MISGCALNHGLEKVCACGKGPCAKVWDVRARWLCTVRDRQFALALAFAMTINKSQGQGANVVGIDLRVPCFSHGQLYVAFVWQDALLQPR